jgi:ferredoxin
VNGERDTGMFYIDSARCTGCGACVEMCPTGAIHLVEGATGRHAEIDQADCSGCRACLAACPEGAIVSQVEPALEGELVQEGIDLVPAASQRREVGSMPKVSKAVTWVGAALLFAAREILPRVATSLLEVWNRQANSPASYTIGPQPNPPPRRTVTNPSRRAGGQHRHRRGRG